MRPTTISPSDLLLTRKEVAELLKVSTKTVERLPIPYLKVGRLPRYRREDVVKYVEGRVA